jgi:hypothetical protein
MPGDLGAGRVQKGELARAAGEGAGAQVGLGRHTAHDQGIAGPQQVYVDDTRELLGDDLHQGTGQCRRRGGAGLGRRRDHHGQAVLDDGIEDLHRLRRVAQRAHRPAGGEGKQRPPLQGLRPPGQDFAHSTQIRHAFGQVGVGHHVLPGGGETGIELIDVQVLGGQVAAHHGAHVEVDVLERIHQAADVIVVGEHRIVERAVQVQHFHRLATGAHVDPVAAEAEIVARVAAGEQHLGGRARQRVLHQLVIDENPVAFGVDAAARGGENVAAEARQDLDAGALEDTDGAVDDAPDIGLVEGPIAAASQSRRNDRLGFGPGPGGGAAASSRGARA